jgi:hypothetical protein
MTTKKCKKCELSFSLSCFGKDKSQKDKLSRVCKKCKSKYSKLAEWRRDIREEAIMSEYGIAPRFAQDRLSIYKARSKKLKLDFNLTSNYLMELWKSQSGLCAYTKTKMILGHGSFHFYSPSLDKLDPSKGYVVGNVVWCLHGVNCFKQTLSLEEFYRFVTTVTWYKPSNEHR